MVMCWAPGCRHYNERETCKFFRFPKDPKIRKKWIHLLRRTDEPGPGSFVCSCHFFDGKKENQPELFKHNEGKLLNFSDPEKRKNRRKEFNIDNCSECGIECVPGVSVEQKEQNIPPGIVSQEDITSTNREDKYRNLNDKTHDIEEKLLLSPSSSTTLTSSEAEFEMKKQESHHFSANIESKSLSSLSSTTFTASEDGNNLMEKKLLEPVMQNDYRKERMAKKKCFVATCSNTHEKTKNLCVIDEKSCTLTVITYHTFPRHPELRQKWIEATGRTNWEPTIGNYICSEHFRESDYETLKSIQPEDDDNPTQLKRVLKKHAVPTLQLGTEANLQKCPLWTSAGISLDINEKYKSLANKNEHIFSMDQNIDLSIVKDEPNQYEEFDNSTHKLPFVITSANTINDENNFGGEQNGHLEGSDEFSNMHNLEQDHSSDFYWPKRLKHQDSLIAPEDIKIERCPSPFSVDPSLPIEEKYEHLLSEFMKLKRDYDLLKFKFDRQSDAISRCEHILSECR